MTTLAKEPTKPTAKDKEYVLKLARDLRVKFIRLWFTDILGFLKSVAITVEELEEALEEGVGFDGSSIEGFARIEEGVFVAAEKGLVDMHPASVFTGPRLRHKGRIDAVFERDLLDDEPVRHRGISHG